MASGLNIWAKPAELEHGKRSSQGFKFSMQTGSLGIIPTIVTKGLVSLDWKLGKL